MRSIPLKLKGTGYPEEFEIGDEILLAFSEFDRIIRNREKIG